MNYKHLSILLIILVAACSPATDAPTVSEDEVILIEVDGAPISLAMLERVMEVRGVSDGEHERMRELLDELIRTQAVANAARREGMDRSSELRADLRLAEMQTLYGHYIRRSQREQPVTDAQIEEVYAAQLARSGDRQYRIAVIPFADQHRALNALERIESGLDFATLGEEAAAEGRSVSTPRWIDRSQVPEEFAVALEASEAGAVVPLPLELAQGWHVVHLLDTRPLEVPALDSVREGIARSLLQQQREALVERLYQQAEITPLLPLDES